MRKRVSEFHFQNDVFSLDTTVLYFACSRKQEMSSNTARKYPMYIPKGRFLHPSGELNKPLKL